MKTLAIPNFTRFGAISLTAIGLIFAGLTIRDKVPFFGAQTIGLSRTTDVSPQFLPFAYNDIVRYFEDALGFRAQEHFANQVVFHGGTTPDDFYTITVTRRGTDLLVNFSVVDDYGMNMVREFFEAPFFQRYESEQFYSMLNGRDVTRMLHMPRFNVLFEYNSPGLAANINMIFSPRVPSLSAP